MMPAELPACVNHKVRCLLDSLLFYEKAPHPHRLFHAGRGWRSGP